MWILRDRDRDPGSGITRFNWAQQNVMIPDPWIPEPESLIYVSSYPLIGLIQIFLKCTGLP